MLSLSSSARYFLYHQPADMRCGIYSLAALIQNYLFAGIHATAQTAAMIYSLLATCKKNGVNPHDWLLDVQRKLNDPNYDGRFSDLLPHRWKNHQGN